MKGPEDEEDSKEDITPPPVGKSIQGGISTKGFAVGESGGSAKGGGPPGMNRAMSMKRSNSQWIKDDK